MVTVGRHATVGAAAVEWLFPYCGVPVSRYSTSPTLRLYWTYSTESMIDAPQFPHEPAALVFNVETTLCSTRPEHDVTMFITEMGSLNVRLRTFCTCVVGLGENVPPEGGKVAKNIR